MKNTLNLLFIDSNQLYAERIVELLSIYYGKVTLGFLDDSAEFEKLLRRKWDVLVYGRAYDLKLADVQTTIKEKNIDLPIVSLLTKKSSSFDLNEEGLPIKIDTEFVRSVNPNNEAEVIISIVLQHRALLARQEIKQLTNIISEAEQRANILIKNSKSAVAYIDQGIHVFANEPYLELFGFDDMNDLMGLPVIDLISGGDDIKEFKQFLRKFTKGNRHNVEFEFESKRKDGTTFAAKLQLAAATFEGQPVSQVIIQQNRGGVDAAEIEARLAEAERQDSLTGLENRKGLQSRIANFVDITKSGATVLGFMYIRVDNLIEINSLVGIDAVDATVIKLADYLKSKLESDYLCRFSDSVYVAAVNNADVEKMKQLASTMVADVNDMIIEVGKRSVTTSISIGMALMDAQTPSAETVLKRASDAHNKAIENEDDDISYHLYDPSEHASSDDAVLAEYLSGAIANNKFKLAYQPIYDVQADTSDKFEVGIRLELSDGKLMMPGEFLGVAEKHQLMAKIDKWMLINSCKQLSQVRAQNPSASIIVRLTHFTLVDEQLPNFVQQLIQALGGDASALTLQFDEKDVISYMTVAKKLFDQLSSMNAMTSISSFGASEKSIELLPYIQPNMVKLDRGYVKDLSVEENLNRIKEVIALSSEQGISTLMPFIEDASTMSVSWSVGARYLQGDYLQEPTLEMTFGE